MRIAAIADLHCRADSAGVMRKLLDGVAESADVLVLGGDLTDTGLPAEMQVLLDDIGPLDLPIVAVLGNHDHESNEAPRLAEMLAESGVRLLDGSVVEIGDVGFVGTKGFCGGFDGRMVQPFGEQALKRFIQASIDEAVQLESATTKLDCRAVVGVLHYAPVSSTLEGEPLELWPLLGTSRLANALDRHGVRAIIHGHAHHGAPEGRTPGGAPVYNVSRFVHSRHGLPPYRVFEV
jgi:Icc-related predicted phosphoesterase